MRRTGLLWIAVAAMVITMSGCSREGSKAPGSEEPAARPAAVGTGGAGANLSDDEFVRDVARKNMAEVELSRMALEKAANPAIKTFARQMIDDHVAAGDNLKSVVSGQPFDWPAQPDDKYKETADELAEKQGTDFDRDFVEAMIEGHQDLAAKLESRLDVKSLADWKTAAAARADRNTLPDPNVALRDVQVRPNTSDNELTRKINQWAADTYPIAQKHLDTARSLENATKKRSSN